MYDNFMRIVKTIYYIIYARQRIFYKVKCISDIWVQGKITIPFAIIIESMEAKKKFAH